MKSNNQSIKNVNLISKDILESIPNKPRIPLYNYLLHLTSRSDGKERSIYMNKVDPFIKGVWDEIVKENYRKLNVREFIPEELGVSTGVFYAYKNGRKRISIQMLYKILHLWEGYCNKSKKDVNKKWDEIFENEYTFSVSAYYAKTKLPRYITPKLSYLVGWLVGDGHFNDKGNHYLVKISEKSTGQLKYILKPLFKKSFNVETPIFKRFKGGYAIQIGSKPIYRFLTQVLKIKVGKIPEIVWRMDKINKKYFLLGIFDSEGCVHSGRFRLSFAQADRSFLEKIKTIFEKEFDIHFNGPTFHKTKLGEWYTIKVDSKREVLKFYNKFGSCHIDKLQKLYEMVKRID